MRMFHFGGKSDETTYGVLIDVSSGSVGVGIVSSVLGEKLPHIIYAHRNVMRITKHGAEKSEHVRRIREALLSATLLLSQDGVQALLEHNKHARISKLYVTCSAPWAYTIARDVYYENDEPFKVTSAIVNDLIESAESQILTELEHAPLVTENGFSIVERATVDITVNDYPVHDPLKLKGRTLGLSHIVGLIPEDIFSSITEVQEKLFPHTELRAHTYMLIMYCVLRDIFYRVHSLCIVDVTGEATEIAIVEHNVLVENLSIPTGSNTFIRDVMEKTGKPATDIQSCMAHDADAALDTTVLHENKSTYEEEVKNTLLEILERRTLPKDIIVTVHNHKLYGQFFTPIVESAYASVIGKKPHILKLKDAIMDEVIGNSAADEYLALSARFFHKLHGCGELEKDK